MTAEWLEEFCAYWSNWGITIQPPSAIMESDGAPTLIDDVYKLSNEGAATITTSSTTVDVSHGLVAAPTRVILSPTTDTAGKRFWVSAKGATTFTISIDSPAGSDISFDWMATL